jgi:exodeoxyribonuclease VII small subunit
MAQGDTAQAGQARGGSPPRRPGYEEARDQLADLVKRLEAGGLTLEQSLELWERGERLAAICEEWLEGARARLAAAIAPAQGTDARGASPENDGAADEAARPF